MLLKGASEENVLTVLCWNEQHCTELARRLTAKLFSTRPYKAIVTAAIEYIIEFNEPPRDHMPDLLEARLQQGAEGKLIRLTLDEMARVAPKLNIRYVMSRLDTFIEMQQLETQLTNAFEALEKGDVKKAREVMRPVAQPGKLTPGTFLSDTDNSLRFFDENEDERFTSGVPTLDQFGVVPRRGTQFLYLAAAKRGKSWWAIEMGKHNIRRGYPTLHISLEMPEEQVLKRYVQSFLALTDGRQLDELRTTLFQRDELNRFIGYEYHAHPNGAWGVLDSSMRYQIARRIQPLKRRAPLLVKGFPSGSLTLGHFEAYLDMLAADFGFEPAMVLLDYPDLMHIDSDQLRTDLGFHFRALRGIAGERNFALVTPTQGNRPSATAKMVRSDMVAEDWSKIGTADVICTYSQTDQEFRQGLARIHVANARASLDKFTVLISQNYAIGQFCVDSIMFDSFAAKSIDKEASQRAKREEMRDAC